MPSTMPRNKMIDKGGMREQRWAKTSRKQQRRQEVAVDHMPSMIRKQSRHPFSSPQRKHLRGVEKGLYFYPKASGVRRMKTPSKWPKITRELARAANSGGPGGPTGPLCTPPRTPWLLSI